LQNDHSVFSTLTDCLKDKDYFVREEAIKGLRELKDIRSIPYFISAIRDKGGYVRNAAAWAAMGTAVDFADGVASKPENHETEVRKALSVLKKWLAQCIETDIDYRTLDPC
jgi:HEAT repeat protein